MNKYCKLLMAYIDSSPTPFHALAEASRILKESGFVQLQESESWAIKSNRSYYITRNDSSLIAFTVPDRSPESFRIIGAHTDSPNLRLKPYAEYTIHGYIQFGVEVYGGALLNTWIDRDLSLAGRVTYHDGLSIKSGLIKFDSPLCTIPQLAIHLNRKANDGVKLNKQKHLPPVFGIDYNNSKESNKLLEMIGERLKIKSDSIKSFDLHLYPIEKASLSGVNQEFIQAARLDNLSMCCNAVSAITECKQNDNNFIPLIALFDNEETGSESQQGAGSPFLKDTLERVMVSLECNREEYLRSLVNSFFISADMAHAIHPNFPDKHDDNHKPAMNKGPVIKINSNHRYATDSLTDAYFEILCEKAKIPFQKFINRTDLSCGSTIGPITAANLGIKTVDVGNAMLSMHSAREMAGSKDPEYMVRAFNEFFKLDVN